MVIFLTLLHWWAKWWGVKCSAMMNSYLELLMSGKGSHGVTCLPQSPLYNLRMACGRACKYLIGKNWKTFLETSAGQCTNGNVSNPAYALNISNIKGGGACSVLSHTCIKWKWLVGSYPVCMWARQIFRQWETVVLRLFYVYVTWSVL